MRPALRPGLLPLWRDRDTVQFGADPRRAVAVTGGSQTAEVISLLDGSRDRHQVTAEAGRRGVSAAVAERVLTVLATAGVLIDYPAQLLRSLPAELRRQLLPVLAAASLTGQDGDGGAQLLARRAATRVSVVGDGDVAHTLATLLTQAGVAAGTGWPGGLANRPDVTVLVGYQPPELIAALHRLRCAHLAVTACEAVGVVGPLVWPGSTACLHCLDLARADRDPAWPRVLAQLPGRSAQPLACDPILATAVAAQAATLIAAAADRAPLALAAVNGTLELVPPAWQWRRRSWRPHPACGCGARTDA